MKNERTSSRVARLAAIAITRPDLLTPKELKALAGSALTQVAPKKRKKRRARRKKRVAVKKTSTKKMKKSTERKLIGALTKQLKRMKRKPKKKVTLPDDGLL